MVDEFVAKRIMEGLLFLSPSPLSIKDLKVLTGFNTSLINKALKELIEDYQERGIQIKAVAGAYHMATNPDIFPYIEKLRIYTKGLSLSKAALETLAIIAYRQPITRGQVEEIRSVNVDGIINKLLDMKLIRIQGRANLPGKPVLFGTSKEFLRNFSLNKISDLPEYQTIKTLEYNKDK